MQIEKIAKTVFTPLADGTAVLLNLDTLAYYSLNSSAAAFWQAIDNGNAQTLADLVNHACQTYEVDDLRAHQTLREFINRLVEYKIIRV
jgi:hypothetical protein